MTTTLQGTLRGSLLTVAVLAIVGGLVLVAHGHHLPRGAFHVVVLAGTALITGAVMLSPTPLVAITLSAVYVFVAVDCFFFFPWVLAMAHLAVLLTAQTAALLSHDAIGLPVPIVGGSVCIAVATVVGRLVAKASVASRDGLTGLLNRRGLDDALDAALTAADRNGAPLSLALLDVDRFKTVNDHHGHATGDRLLQSVAAACVAAAAPGTPIARFGGDEFVLLLSGSSAVDARAVVERVRAGLEGCDASCGVAQRRPGETAGDLLRRADSALYAAKAGGRGRTNLSGDGSDELATSLAQALHDGRIDVAFQPILSVEDRTVVGLEALARWQDPVHGTIPPSDFVPVAEAAGLIGVLGSQVLVRACAGARQLQSAWGRPLFLTVNVSGRELTTPGYAASTLRTLRATGWSADQLVVEVTESLMDGTAPASLQALRELRSHGISVAIDDFGTGYSSFSRLDVLPADYLKLDHSFIAGTITSPRRAGMLRGILALADTLGLTVIAEGVETPAHERLLAELSCPLAQGYLYDAPLPLEQLLERYAHAASRSAASR